MKGVLENIQHYCIHDGPGIRTVVFLKGCPLRCRWCSNPTTQEHKPELLYHADKCFSCGHCAEICPQRAVTREGEAVIFDRALCDGCGLCAKECPGKALQIAGVERNTADVLEDIQKDMAFYRNSGGGVTFGGGEPTAAGAFLLGLLDASIRRGYHICLDTCGVCEPERFRKIMNQVELFLFDCKHMDPDEHKRLTGLDNVLILQNLHALFEAKKALRIRVPLMPGINDTEKNIAQMAAFLHKHGHNEVDVLPCHTFGHSKYAALNLADPVMVPYQPEELAAALERFAKYDLKVTIV